MPSQCRKITVLAEECAGLNNRKGVISHELIRPGVKQDKASLHFKSAGIISDYTRYYWTRTQIDKVEPGKVDELFKCEELESLVGPSLSRFFVPMKGYQKACGEWEIATIKAGGLYGSVRHSENMYR